MTPERAKALTKCCRIIRMALDTRTPEGEREAAGARARVIVQRWEFSEDEVRLGCEQLERASETVSDVREREAALAREAVRRERQRQAAAGMNVGYGPVQSTLGTVRLDDGRIVLTFEGRQL